MIPSKFKTKYHRLCCQNVQFHLPTNYWLDIPLGS